MWLTEAGEQVSRMSDVVNQCMDSDRSTRRWSAGCPAVTITVTTLVHLLQLLSDPSPDTTRFVGAHHGHTDVKFFSSSIRLDRGVTLPTCCGEFVRGDRNALLIPSDSAIREHIGRAFRDILNRFDRGYLRGLPVDHIHTATPLLPLRFMILVQIDLKSDHHPDHLLFVDLHAPSDGIAVRGVVQFGCFDQIFSSVQQAGTLRSPDPLAA